MVETSEGGGPFECQDVGGTLDDAEEAGVPTGVGTDRAERILGEVETTFAVTDPLAKLPNGGREGQRILHRCPQEVKRQTLGRLAPHTRQLAELFDDPFDRERQIRHVEPLAHPGQIETGGHATGQRCDFVVDLAARLVDGGHHQIFEEVRFGRIDGVP